MTKSANGRTGEARKWSTLSAGDTVEIREGIEVVASGTVEDHTSNKDIIWIRLSDCNERKIFLRSDELDFEIL
ncbi:hypothetical protein [Arthrobacter sp. Rue61a]|uniref:hypothetical protein n=1 Tax=Arthrobacter sp. Rue61a TaxID=1118963 RepID=UPI00027DF42A|nr:hypothetical protein [Arthrobacter sp. Rue61a]AFR31352.1 hypothetical protein ARUE_232p01440 [Arthrobacter sp. Rue61a]